MDERVTPHTVIFSDTSALAEAAADLFVQAAYKALDEKGQFRVAVSGGRTPRLLFERLASHAEAKALPWSQCHVFWVDERAVPVTDPASNFKMANDLLLEPLNVPMAAIHRMPTEIDLDAAVAQYESTIRSVFSILPGQVPEFDLIQLGMGPDGHTASLFPHAYPPDTDKLVVWTVPPEAPHRRMTLTPRVLQAASRLVVLLNGKDKADMLRTVFSGELDVMHYPIQTLWPALDRVVWLMDQDAGSELRG